MLTRKAVVAYCMSCFLDFLSLILALRVMKVPWLDNSRGQTIGLWRFNSEGRISVEFPGRRLCISNAQFCTNWKTGTFLLTLSLVPKTLVLIALCFSWAFHHRKKTVVVAKYLLISSLMLDILGIFLWRAAYADIRTVLRSSHWKLVGGWHLVVLSWVINGLLLSIIIPFRSIVRSEGEFLDNDSDNDNDSLLESDTDNISVPDNIPPEQVDFYVFRKQARRLELARLGG